MTEGEARAVIAEAMAYASVHGAWDDGLARRFLAADAGDTKLDDLDLDSLSVMELCIAIEAHAGVELVPERLRRARTLDGLVRLVCAHRP